MVKKSLYELVVTSPTCDGISFLLCLLTANDLEDVLEQNLVCE